MNPKHSVTVHTPHGAAPTSPDQLRRVVQSLVLPAADPATSYSHRLWDKHQPIQPTPGSTLYSTTIPDGLKTIRPRSHSPSPQDWAVIPDFRHWVPPLATGTEPRTTAGPSSPARSGLKKRTQAAEEDGSDTHRKEKKRVRIESPATTTSRTTSAVRAGAAAVDIKITSPGEPLSSIPGDGPVRRSSRNRQTSAQELVPATPEEKSSSATPTEAPDLAIGAIQRCIPSPYHHTVSHNPFPANYPEPRKQSRVIHSYVDPSYSPTSSGSSASRLRRKFPDLSVVSPKTSRFLVPGRQGSWLIPVSGRLPLDLVSPPAWHSRPPRPLPTSTASAPLAIDWTSTRLSALWSYLTQLNESSAFGPLRATCHLASPRAPPSSSSSSTTASRDPRSTQTALPEYVKVTIDAPLALSFRTFLNWVSVSNAPSTRVVTSENRSRVESKANYAKPGRAKLLEKETNVPTSAARTVDGPELEADSEGKSPLEAELQDAERWLNGRPLVWIDESGRAILVA
ncbi:hypothetical protein JCM11491_005179 [Sporobolomyces phaffii]